MRELRPPPRGPAGVIIRRRRDSNGAAQPAAKPRESEANDRPQGHSSDAATMAAAKPMLAAIGEALVNRGELDMAAVTNYYERHLETLLALNAHCQRLGNDAPAEVQECLRLSTDAYELSHAMFAPLLHAVEPASGYPAWKDPQQEPVRPLMYRLAPDSEAGQFAREAAIAARQEKAGEASLVSVVPEPGVAIVVDMRDKSAADAEPVATQG